jgi:alpha-beta hydrolase superfamily lysophospholipase
MSKPSILLAPHSFGLPEFYDPVFDAVRAKGYDIQGLHLPSSGLRAFEGRPGTPPTMYDDANYLAREVEKLADTGKDVVLIGHSYSGVPVSQCAKGLSKEERRKQGKPGGLVNLAYLSSPVPPVGGHGNSFRAEVHAEHIVEMVIPVRHFLLEPS